MRLFERKKCKNGAPSARGLNFVFPQNGIGMIAQSLVAQLFEGKTLLKSRLV
jgi:hypothetical protein